MSAVGTGTGALPVRGRRPLRSASFSVRSVAAICESSESALAHAADRRRLAVALHALLPLGLTRVLVVVVEVEVVVE
eukprot:scaffold143104_cov169-Phaeocystis_antarctica.AAC.1